MDMMKAIKGSAAAASVTEWREQNAAGAQERPLRIFVILPVIKSYGGVISVINLIAELEELGHTCILATMSEYGYGHMYLRIEPFVLGDIPAQAAAIGPVDIVMATSWETVPHALRFLEFNPQAKPVYFVQDYEVDFLPETDVEKRAIARQTYSDIETRVVKTRFLQQRLEKEGITAHRIRPGMNKNIFYRRDVPRGPKKRVLAFARPDAPNDQRGWSIIVEAFKALHAARKDIEFGMFGVKDLPQLDFSCRNFGSLQSDKLPEVYSWADVYFDASRFHGFGRTGVEAMACGTSVVLADSGGIHEYARDGENAFIVPVGDVEASVRAINSLLDDASRREKFVQAGYAAVKDYDDIAAAREMLRILRA